MLLFSLRFRLQSNRNPYLSFKNSFFQCLSILPHELIRIQIYSVPLSLPDIDCRKAYGYSFAVENSLPQTMGFTLDCSTSKSVHSSLGRCSIHDDSSVLSEKEECLAIKRSIRSGDFRFFFHTQATRSAQFRSLPFSPFCFVFFFPSTFLYPSISCPI